VNEKKRGIPKINEFDAPVQAESFGIPMAFIQ
jgi:hypothetical protein